MELHVALDGYLLAWMGDDLGLHFGALGLIWFTAWKALVACGLPWVGQGPQMSYLALLCRREHQFEGPGGPKGSMGGLGLLQTESPCGPLWHGPVTP